jgi:hypothetical protein
MAILWVHFILNVKKTRKATMKILLLVSILLLIFNTAYAVEQGNARLMIGSSEMMIHEENPISIEITSGQYEGCIIVGTVYPDHTRGYIKDAKISCIFEKNRPFERNLKNLIISDKDGLPGIPTTYRELPEDIQKQYKFYCENAHDEVACKAYISSPCGLFQVHQNTPIKMYWEIIQN